MDATAASETEITEPLPTEPCCACCGERLVQEGIETRYREGLLCIDCAFASIPCTD
ncbi:MAG TPA: hypothetical protein VLX92_21745 [Kofleriaceae bacterium]|nr:hypothetical protein [Kofleriaceae bacterium]